MVPVLNVAVPKIWVFLAGNVLTQYPWSFLNLSVSLSYELISLANIFTGNDINTVSSVIYL